MMVKLSEEVIAKFGAVNAADFNTKLLAFIGSCESALQAQAGLSEKLSAIETSVSGLSEKLKASEGLPEKLSAISARVDTINPETISAKAEEAGSRAAAKALGKVGASGAEIANHNANEGTQERTKGFSEIVAGYVAGGKSKAEAVTHAIQNHPKEYAAARAAGNIKL